MTVENNGKKPLVSKLLVVIRQEWGKGPQDPFHRSSADYLEAEAPKGTKR